MAFEGGQLTVVGALAGADLSTKLFHFVKKSATNLQFTTPSVDGEIVIGVQQNKPDAAGKTLTVAYIGVTKMECGENLTAGDFVGTDNAGKAKKIDVSATGADVGDYIAGVVLEGASSGELCTVLLIPGYRVFAS